MKKTKRIISLVLAVILMIALTTALAACSKKTVNKPAEETSGMTDAQVTVDEPYDAGVPEVTADIEETAETTETTDSKKVTTTKKTGTSSIAKASEIIRKKITFTTKKYVTTAKKSESTTKKQTPTTQKQVSTTKKTESVTKTTASSGKFTCKSANHHCTTKEEHDFLCELEAKGCPICGSHSCRSFYSIDEWGNNCYDITRCPKYSEKKDPANYCEHCGKEIGLGDNGTCVRFTVDTVCPICGKTVKAKTCHTH